MKTNQHSGSGSRRRGLHRGSADRGLSMVEVLITIFLLGIFGTVVATTVIGAMKTTRESADGVSKQASLNDAVARITRDITVSDPILPTTSTNGWPDADASPGGYELWLQTVRSNKCVRTHYYVNDTDANNKKLMAKTFTYANATCPSASTMGSGYGTKTETVIERLLTENDTLPVFTYFSKANQSLVSPVAAGSVSGIARVGINVGAAVRDRPGGVRLATSAVPRSRTNLDPGNGADLIQCPVLLLDSSGTKPVLTWYAVPDATSYTLTRTAGSATTVVSTQPAGQPTYTVTDTTAPNQATYVVNATGAAGSSTGCPTVVWDYQPTPLGTPVLATALAPASTTPDLWTGYTAPRIDLTWTAVTEANQYELFRRPLANGLPSGSGSWTSVTTTTSTTFQQNVAFDSTYEYYVIARNTTDGRVSAPSNANSTTTPTPDTVVTQPASVTATGSPTTYNKNTIAWGPLSSAHTGTAWVVYRRAPGVTAWTNLSGTLPAATTSYVDSTPALGSTWEYRVASSNSGIRGKDGTRVYFSPPSNTVTVLQFPANPAAVATGTEVPTNPDGQNTVAWPTVPTANAYRVFKFDTISADANATALVGTALSYADTGKARGSREFYMVGAYNPTGGSPNTVDPAANLTAYQRPPTPNVLSYNAPTLAGLNTDMSYSETADAGESTDTFCGDPGNPGACSYSLKRGNTVLASLTGDPASTAWAGLASDWGATDLLDARACNKGGCSDTLTQVVLAYPGPYDSVEPDFRYENRGKKWSGTTVVTNPDENSYLKARWTASAGAVRYYAGMVAGPADPFDRKSPAAWTPGLATPASGAWYSPAVVDGGAYTERVAPEWQVTPGYGVYYQLRSYAANGLFRDQAFSTIVGASQVQMLQGAKFCNLNQRANGWKPGFDLAPYGSSFGQDVPINNVLVSWWVGKLTDNQAAGGGADTIAAKAQAVRGTTNNPANWVTNGNWMPATAYYGQQNYAGDPTPTGTGGRASIADVPVGGASNTRLVSNQQYTAFRVDTVNQLTPPATNPTTYGFWETLGQNSMDLKSLTGQVACNGTATGWRYGGDVNSIGRWAATDAGWSKAPSGGWPVVRN